MKSIFEFANTKLRHSSIKPTQSGGIWSQGNGETEDVRSLEPLPTFIGSVDVDNEVGVKL